MKKNTQEKSLVESNEKNIFYRMKNFLRKLFYKDKMIESNSISEENINSNLESEEKKSAFIESIMEIEDEETKLLKLQKQYRNGEIKEEDLTEEQIILLCTLYDNQIAKLKKSNQKRKQKILDYRKRLQSEN